MSQPIHVACAKCGVTNAIPAEKLGLKARCGKCGEPLALEKTTVQPVHVDEVSFDRKVLQSDLPVLVDFWASWCAPCRAIAPSLEKVAEEYHGRLVVAKVNTDENQSLAKTYNIQAIPTLVLFEKGRIREQITGALPVQQLRVWIAKGLGWL